MATTAAALIRMSMQDLGVLGAGESARGEDLADGLRRLQIMLSAWSLDPLTVLQTERYEFPITPMKGTYTIGPGLDFDVPRPVGQQSVVRAGLILNKGQPNENELKRSVLTYDAYAGITLKNQTNSLFTSVFYRPGSLARVPPSAPTPPGGIDYGEIVLWQIPTQANPLVLYIERTLPLFDNLTTSYPVPEGIVAAIQHNLTLAIAPMFQVEAPSYIIHAAGQAMAGMKRTNYQFTDVAVDPMFTMQTPVGGYDINTGGMTRHG